MPIVSTHSSAEHTQSSEGCEPRLISSYDGQFCATGSRVLALFVLGWAVSHAQKVHMPVVSKHAVTDSDLARIYVSECCNVSFHVSFDF